MTDDEQVELANEIAVDEDMDEQLEDLSLEGRKAALKRARWNVFMYLGIAAILFGFALFPMPFGADYDNFTNSAEKDVGYIWGLPIPGDDFTDVPVTISVEASSVPENPEVLLGAYLIQADDCQSNLGEFTQVARNGSGHNHHYQVTKDTPIEGATYDFKFDVDPSAYCMIVQYVNANGENLGNLDESEDMKVNGKMWPNQIFAGVFGLCCLFLSIFAFIGAQKHGETVRSMLEGTNETTESKVLSEISKDKIASGPAGAPPSGPTGGPTSGPTSGPPGAPPAEVEQNEPVAEEVTEGTGERFEETDNGYYFKIYADGTYAQSVYVKSEDGSFSAYEE
jgi:hypothetical protein